MAATSRTRRRRINRNVVSLTTTPTIIPRTHHSDRTSSRMVSARDCHISSHPSSHDSSRPKTHPADSSKDLATIMREIMKGHPDAFETLWDRTQPFLWRYTKSLDAESQQDLRQTMALGLWGALQRHPPRVLSSRGCHISIHLEDPQGKN